MKSFTPIESIEPRLPDYIEPEKLDCIGEYEEEGRIVHVYPARPAINYCPDSICKPRKRNREAS